MKASPTPAGPTHAGRVSSLSQSGSHPKELSLHDWGHRSKSDGAGRVPRKNKGRQRPWPTPKMPESPSEEKAPPIRWASSPQLAALIRGGEWVPLPSAHLPQRPKCCGRPSSEPGVGPRREKGRAVHIGPGTSTFLSCGSS